MVYVGKDAFLNCKNLRQVNVDTHVLYYLNDEAFRGCDLLDLIQMQSILNVGRNAFTDDGTMASWFNSTLLSRGLDTIANRGFYTCHALRINGWPTGYTDGLIDAGIPVKGFLINASDLDTVCSKLGIAKNDSTRVYDHASGDTNSYPVGKLGESLISTMNQNGQLVEQSGVPDDIGSCIIYWSKKLQGYVCGFAGLRVISDEAFAIYDSKTVNGKNWQQYRNSGAVFTDNALVFPPSLESIGSKAFANRIFTASSFAQDTTIASTLDLSQCVNLKSVAADAFKQCNCDTFNNPFAEILIPYNFTDAKIESVFAGAVKNGDDYYVITGNETTATTKLVKASI